MKEVSAVPASSWSGRPLTHRLVRRGVLVDAVLRLLDQVEHYTILAQRSRFHPVTGEEREPLLALTERDRPLATDGNDERLIGLRGLSIIVVLPDREAAIIDLTRRRYAKWLASAHLEEKLSRFRRDLRIGAVSYLVSPFPWLCLALATFAVTAWVLDATHVSAITLSLPSLKVSPTNRADPPIALWIRIEVAAGAVIFFLSLATSGILSLLKVIIGGPLKILPEGIRWKTVRKMLRDFRLRNLTMANFDRIIWLILTVVVTVVLTKLLS